ncbi:hypothetical protein MO867_13400 [Microbulbifer sp. OS29]|uniref:Mor transcription activator domain-containing protein n=1 Tax=Microbulbifer okhotskensis TaxID=2926617 RepID=A0A9X2ETL8_9GAMM|nr:Mor transcription activator family protein [Microbulbifer okhotskensis]MCO1335328.1 hypothetical protein [Microbulbifer okhotskensis]
MSHQDPNMESRRHELLEEIHAHAREVLTQHGVDSDIADQAGCAIADHLATTWGGQIVTVPKDYHYRVASRDAQIYEEFNGRNHSQLARKYGMTVRGIYKVISRVRAKGDPNQPGLF